MEREFFNYYERELQHLLEMGGEFAREHPKPAGRLSLDEFGCADPYVERLLEGFAFLSARVQYKLDAEFPRFTQALLGTVYPSYLMPTPSMAVVQFSPDLADPLLAEGVPVPRQTVLRSMLGKGDRTACEFRTCHDLTLWPIEIAEAAYHLRDLAVLKLPSGLEASAALRLRLVIPSGMPFGELAPDRLVFFLSGGDEEISSLLCEACFAHGTGVAVQSVSGSRDCFSILPVSCLRHKGFEDDEAIFPPDPRTFTGYRHIREYFALPERFLFIELSGLAPALQACGDSVVDLVVACRAANRQLEDAVTPGSFALNCTPAVNMFVKRTDRVRVTRHHADYHVMVDKTRPVDFEVLQVLSVTGYSSDLVHGHEFLPFYAATDASGGDSGGGEGAYYTVHRRPRNLTDREVRFGSRSAYRGHEVFLSLADASHPPFGEDLRELGVVALCSNRDLPIQMPAGTGATDFTLEVNLPVGSVRCLRGPTKPVPSLADTVSAWRVISHLRLNYLSLAAGSDGSEGAAAVQDILRLYCSPDTAHLQRQIAGVLSVSVRPVVRRASGTGPVSFVRGLEVTVLFSEDEFHGSGAFLLAAVLEQFMARYVAINSFTETVLVSRERGEVMRWPARCGSKQLL